MMFIIQILFWLSCATLFYIYAGYPIIMWCLARGKGQGITGSGVDTPCSIVIVAYNEASKLPDKLGSLLASSVVSQIKEIIVVSDGSTDGTVEALRRLSIPQLRVIEREQRQGKAAALNEAVPQSESEIVVLMDARQRVDPRALEELMSYFADPHVGVVSGELIFKHEHATATSGGMGAYWAFEKKLRNMESSFASVPGATGAFYGIRKSLFQAIHENTVLDDVAIPMRIVMQGFRCIFARGACVYDTPSSSAEQERLRKRRTMAGNVQLLQLYPGWLVPWRNPIWFQFVSHKVLRLASPFLLLVILVTNMLLLEQNLYTALLLIQAVFYGAALVGWVCEKKAVATRIFGLPFTFMTLNLSILAGFLDAARGRLGGTWQKAAG